MSSQSIRPLSDSQNARDRLIVALDVDSAEMAEALVRELHGRAGAFKIGLQLFLAAGRGFVARMVDDGHRIFLDLKFHDIPNTVARASVEAARLGVWMFNLHASGGSEMMRRSIAEVAEACDRETLPVPKMIAVTVLTSSGEEQLAETGIEDTPVDQVMRLLKLATDAGMHGVVSSPEEAGTIRNAIADDEFLVVTPGVRPAFATIDDQRRVMTPAEAIRSGSNFLVVGRPIVAAEDPAAACEAVVTEIAGALEDGES